MLITLEGNQLMSKLPGQSQIAIYPESETMFFAKVVDAQIEFPKGDGPAGQMTIHQNGRDITGKRIGDAEFQKLAQTAARDAKRFKDQSAVPGSDQALRKMIEGIRAGKPDYDAMDPALAAITRQQLDTLQSRFNNLGDLQSITFKGVGPGGADIFEVKFAKGGIEYRIWVGVDGKIEGANLRPL
jgi:hypothetical protein